MRNDIFEQTIASVTMRQVAERYGFEIHRGNNILCPFHNDTHPDLRIYPESRGFHCFACGAGGNVVDFVSAYFQISPMQAVLRLDNDFGLGLSTRRPDRREMQRWKREKEEKRREREAFRFEYMARIREFRSLWYMRPPAPEIPQDSPLWGEYAAKLGHMAYLDHWLENTKWR